MKFYGIISPPLKRGVFLFILLVFNLGAFAQLTTSSPYSRFGVGDLQFGGFTKNLGMGGVALGLNQPYNINFSNPASYSYLALTTFEAAVNADFRELKSSTATGQVNNESFGYFAFGFPVKYKKWGMSFGLLPYSSVGYSINDTLTNIAGDQETHVYSGNGGLNQFYFGNSWSPFKDFSVGVNTSFLFGSINQVRKIYYPSGNYLNTRLTDETTINDFYFSFGIQQVFDSIAVSKSDSMVMYDKEKLKISDSLRVIKDALDGLNKAAVKDNQTIEAMKTIQAALNGETIRLDSLQKHVVNRKQKGPWSITLGATGAPSVKLKGSHNILAENYFLYAGEEVVRDTALNLENKSGRLVLPFSLGVGVAAHKGNRWLMGADFSMQNWQDYSLFGQSDSLANSWHVAAGFQFVPNDRAVKSYFSVVQYRLGFHYEQTYLQLKNSQLNQMGVSIGLGLPIRRAATIIQFAVEAGRRGTVSNSLIEENYIKCSVGFSLSDRWFLKPKFD